MRPAVYLLSFGLTVPGMLLALVVQAFVATLKQPSPWSAALYVLERLVDGINWQLGLGLAVLVSLLAFGFFPGTRRVGSAGIAVAALASHVYLAFQMGGPRVVDEGLLFVPGALGILLAGWLLATERSTQPPA